MRVVILSARTGWHTDQLLRALEGCGHAGVVLPYEALVARLGAGPAGERERLSAEREELRSADAVLARIIPAGSLEQIIYRVDALHWLEDGGVPVVNSPRAIERTVDKFYTSALLHGAGLRTPETVVCERPEDALAAFRELGGDAIIKPLFGSMGLGMVRVSDEETAWRVVRALDAIRGVYYLQRAIDHGGRDVRAFVIGGRVVGAIERESREPGGWRTNVSRGGRARAIAALPPEWEAAAVRAADAVGADYAGVDLLPERGTDALHVLEVNGIPGWRGLQEATGLDVSALLVSHLEHVVDAARRRRG